MPTTVMEERGVIPKKTPADTAKKPAEKPSGAAPMPEAFTKAPEPKKAPTVSAKELADAPLADIYI